MTEFAAERPRTRNLRIVLELAVVVLFALLIWNNYTLRRNHVRGAAAPPEPSRSFLAKDMLETVPTIALDGTRGTLDLRRARSTVAIVDPRCESCKELIAQLKPRPDLHVLSVAPLGETRQMARERGLTAVTRTIGESVPGRTGAQLHNYPQLLIVDRGRVVRTCATVAECQ